MASTKIKCKEKRECIPTITSEIDGEAFPAIPLAMCALRWSFSWRFEPKVSRPWYPTGELTKCRNVLGFFTHLWSLENKITIALQSEPYNKNPKQTNKQTKNSNLQHYRQAFIWLLRLTSLLLAPLPTTVTRVWTCILLSASYGQKYFRIFNNWSL